MRTILKTIEIDYLWSVTQRRILKWYHTRDTQNLRNEVSTSFCVRYAKPSKCTKYLWCVTQRRILKWYLTRDTQNLRNEVLSSSMVFFFRARRKTIEMDYEVLRKTEFLKWYQTRAGYYHHSWYSCNKITTTQIQISRQNWNGFFSNISHQVMI